MITTVRLLGHQRRLHCFFFSGALHNMAYMGGLSPSVQCDICV
jgi:hypothetical protein